MNRQSSTRQMSLRTFRLGCAMVFAVPGLLLCLLALSLVTGARVAVPVALTGTITSFDRVRHFHFAGCLICAQPYHWDDYNVSLKANDAGTAGPFRLHTGEFHPPIPDALQQPGSEVTIWYDRGTSDLIGLASGGQQYSMEYLTRPRAKYWDGVGLGVVDGLLGLFLLLVAVGALLLPEHSESQADPTDDDQDQAYGYVALFFYGVTAFIGFIFASIRWGSMPFWGLVIGGMVSIGVAIADGPLIDRLAATTNVGLGWIPRVKYGLSLVVSLVPLVVLPIGMAVMLTIALTFVERQL
jgi:hypothetical protein